MNSESRDERKRRLNRERKQRCIERNKTELKIAEEKKKAIDKELEDRKMAEEKAEKERKFIEWQIKTWNLDDNDPIVPKKTR